jgi:hypothetical protein
MSTPKQIQLSHGGGGREMAELIGKLFFEAFDNQILRQEEDAASLNMTVPILLWFRPCFSKVAISANWPLPAR